MRNWSSQRPSNSAAICPGIRITSSHSILFMFSRSITHSHVSQFARIRMSAKMRGPNILASTTGTSPQQTIWLSGLPSVSVPMRFISGRRVFAGLLHGGDPIQKQSFSGFMLFALGLDFTHFQECVAWVFQPSIKAWHAQVVVGFG